MKRVIAYAALAFFVIFAGLFTYFWYTQASNAERLTQAFLERLNAERKVVTYDSIKTSGFPFKVSVDVVNPVFSGRIDEILKPLQASLPVAPDGSDQAQLKDTLANLPEWQESWALKGNLSLTVDMWANTFSFRKTGTLEGTSEIAGKLKTNMVSASDGVDECKMEVSRGAFFSTELWDFARLEHMTPEEVAKNFRGVECHFASLKLTDKQSNQLWVSHEGANFGVVLNPKNELLTARIYMHIKDLEMTAAMDTYLAEYKKLKLFGNSSFGYASMSDQGKQNLDFELQYEGPKDPNAISSLSPFSVKMDTLSFSSALMNSKSDLTINNAPKGEVANLQVQANSSSTMTPAYNKVAEKMLDDTIAEIMNTQNREYADLREELKAINAEELKTIGRKLLPDYALWGELKIALDAAYSGSAQSEQTIHVKNIELGIKPYGLKFYGDGKQAPNQMAPAGTWMLECRNCVAMIDGVGLWVVDLQTLLTRMKSMEANKGFMLSPEHLSAVKSFLAALTVDASKPDYSFKIVSDGGMGVTINGKNLQQVMTLYSEHMAPVLSKEQPAAVPAVPHAEQPQARP